MRPLGLVRGAARFLSAPRVRIGPAEERSESPEPRGLGGKRKRPAESEALEEEDLRTRKDSNFRLSVP